MCCFQQATLGLKAVSEQYSTPRWETPNVRVGERKAKLPRLPPVDQGRKRVIGIIAAILTAMRSGWR